MDLPNSQPETLDPDAELAALLSAAADPIRLKLLWLLRVPQPVGSLCDELGMAQPRVSHHLAVLRDRGLVDVTPRGRQRVYSWSSPPGGSSRAELQRYLLRQGYPRQALPAAAPGPAAPASRAGAVRQAVPSMEDFLL